MIKGEWVAGWMDGLSYEENSGSGTMKDKSCEFASPNL